MTSWSDPGGGGTFPKSIAPSSACSPPFCSKTNIQARSFADLHFACGLSSPFAAGKALSTLIVVANSRSSALRNCSFSVMAASLFAGKRRPSARACRGLGAPCRPVSSEGDLHDRALDAGPRGLYGPARVDRSEEHTSELQSRPHLVCRLLLEKKKK